MLCDAVYVLISMSMCLFMVNGPTNEETYWFVDQLIDQLIRWWTSSPMGLVEE